MGVTAAVTAGLGALGSLSDLAGKILDRRLPELSKELNELKNELIDAKYKRLEETRKDDPNDELIQDLIMKERKLDEKIEAISETAHTQLAILLDGVRE